MLPSVKDFPWKFSARNHPVLGPPIPGAPVQALGPWAFRTEKALPQAIGAAGQDGRGPRPTLARRRVRHPAGLSDFGGRPRRRGVSGAGSGRSSSRP